MSYQKGSIEKKESGKYLLRYRIRDANRKSAWRKVAELVETTTEKGAEKERDRRMREINHHNETITTSVTSSGTLREFRNGLWQSYLANKGVKPSTVYGYESLLDKYILPILGEKKLSEITPPMITELLNGIARQRQESRGPKLLNLYSLLRNMFEVAVDYDLLDASPVRKKLHRPKYRAIEKPVLTLEEMREVLAKVPGEWYLLIFGDVAHNVTNRRGSRNSVEGHRLDQCQAQGQKESLARGGPR